MTNSANLQLSPEEIRLVMDPGWILTKNSIIGKVVGTFALLSERYRVLWMGNEGLRRAGDGGAGRVAGGVSGCADDGEAGRIGGEGPGPKISRGENYRGLPYVMLDYPRIFGREDVLAIRTMFWWGHAFSVTLHIKGKYRDLLLPVIRQGWEELSAAGFHIGIGEDEWAHEHTPANYRPWISAEDLGPGAQGRGAGAKSPGQPLPFLKLSARCGLDRWEAAPKWLADSFAVLARVLGGS